MRGLVSGGTFVMRFQHRWHTAVDRSLPTQLSEAGADDAVGLPVGPCQWGLISLDLHLRVLHGVAESGNTSWMQLEMGSGLLTA